MAEDMEERLARYAAQGAGRGEDRRDAGASPAEKLVEEARAAVERMNERIRMGYEAASVPVNRSNPVEGQQQVDRQNGLARQARDATEDAHKRVLNLRNFVIGGQMGELHEINRKNLDRVDDKDRALSQQEKRVDSRAIERESNDGLAARAVAFLKGDSIKKQEERERADREEIVRQRGAISAERGMLASGTLAHTHKVDRHEIGPVEAKAYEMVGSRSVTGVPAETVRDLRSQVLEGMKQTTGLESRVNVEIHRQQMVVQSQNIGRGRVNDKSQGQER